MINSVPIRMKLKCQRRYKILNDYVWCVCVRVLLCMYVRVKVVSMMLHAVTLKIQEMFCMQLVQYSYTTLYMGHKITQTMME